MKYASDGQNWIIRLKIGDRLVESLTKFVREHNIKGGWVNALGAANLTELGYYDLEVKQYHWKTINETLEITSLQGNIAWQDDQPVLHLHGSFSDTDMRGFGGHIRELTVGGTCEIFIHTWNGQKQLTRKHDRQIGLDLLHCH